MTRRLTPEQAEQLATTMEEMDKTIQLLQREVQMKDELLSSKTDEIERKEFRWDEERIEMQTRFEDMRIQTEEKIKQLDKENQELHIDHVDLLNQNTDLEKKLEMKEISERKWEMEAMKNEEKLERAEKLIITLETRAAAMTGPNNTVMSIFPTSNMNNATVFTSAGTPITLGLHSGSTVFNPGISGGTSTSGTPASGTIVTGAMSITSTVNTSTSAGTIVSTPLITMTTTTASTTTCSTLVTISGTGTPAASPVTTGGAVTTETSTYSRSSGIPAAYRLKMPHYKAGADIDIFINRYEQFCKTQNISEDDKADYLLNALDDTTFTVIIRELSELERNNYEKLKEHLLRRLDIIREKGQRRLLLRQARRKPGQDLQAFYTDLLSLAAKAYPGPHTAEQAQITDEAIMDQFICGCEDEKIRIFLLDKNPKSSREALSLATAHQSAMRIH